MADPWAKFEIVQPRTGLPAEDPWAKYGAVQAPPASPPPDAGGTSLVRGARLGVQGVTDAVAGTLGGLPDIAAYGLRQAGVPADYPLGGSKMWRDLFDYVGTLPRRVGDAIDQGDPGALTSHYTSRLTPRNDTERLIHGAGAGVGGAASFFLPAGVVARMAPANTATQGVARTLAAQPVMQTAAGATGGAVTELTNDPLIGLTASLAVPGAASLGRRALTPVGEAYLNDEQRRLLQVLTNAGVPTTAGQATGSPFLRTVESSAKFNPMTSAVANADAGAQRAAYNRAITGMTGDAAESVTQPWLAATRQRLGDGFQDVASRNTINLDSQLAADIQTVTTEYARNLNALQRPIFDRIVNEIGTRGATMPGLDYQKLRSTLGRIANGSSDTEYTNALMGLQRALDEAAVRSLSGADSTLWQQLRGQWGALRTIEDAMRATNAGSGDIPPTQLWIASRNRNNPEMRDLARAGQEFVRDTVPNSGTPQRIYSQAAIGGAPFLALDPITAAAMLGLPPAIQAAMRSAPGRAYLTNNLMGGVESPLTARLMADMLAQRELQHLQAPPQQGR